MRQKPEEDEEIKKEKDAIFSLTVFNGWLYSSGPGQDDKMLLIQWP